MPDPVMLAIAAAVAGKATELAVQGGKDAVTSLVALVKRRFASEPSAQAALTAAETDPEAGTDRLANALTFVADGDPEFAEQLRDAWRSASVAQTGDRAVVNQINGDVHDGGTVNQFGNVESVTFNR